MQQFLLGVGNNHYAALQPGGSAAWLFFDWEGRGRVTTCTRVHLTLNRPDRVAAHTRLG